MPIPNFRIWFSGLCHFVENEDPNARCRVCVVIPKASGEEDKNDHVVKVSYATRVQKPKRRVVDHGEIIGKELNQDRVTFIVRRIGDAKPLPPLELPREENTFFFRMSDIAGIYADKDPSIVSSHAADSVAAQVLLEQGAFGFDKLLSIIRPWEVSDLDGNKVKRNVADPVYVEISEVESVSIIISPMDGSAAFEKELELNEGDDFEIIVGARCEKELDPILETRQEQDRIVWVQVDNDFAFHYNLLHDCSREALNRHPTIQQRTSMQASPFPLPESRMLELFISPFLEDAIEIPEEIGADSEANAVSEPPAAGDDAAAASEKTVETSGIEALVKSLLQGGGVSAFAALSAEPLALAVEAFLKKALLSSGATCDCLPCDGRTRVFSLDDHLPGNASTEESEQKKSV